MNNTEKIDYLATLLQALGGTDGANLIAALTAGLDESCAAEPLVVNGCVLVELTDGNMIYDEGYRQHSALVVPEVRDELRSRDLTVMSMRDHYTDVSVLSLTVGNDNVCRHVVGKHNAAPSADQLDDLYQLLAAEGFELQYDPFSIWLTVLATTSSRSRS